MYHITSLLPQYTGNTQSLITASIDDNKKKGTVAILYYIISYYLAAT